MAKREHLDILQGGIAEWNQWREANPHERPLLHDADLSWQHLKYVNFSGAVLNGADFSNSILSQADFTEAILRKANFYNSYLFAANMEGAELDQAEMRYADLRRSSFRKALLTGVDFRNAQLARSNFTNAMIGSTNFGRNDLSEVTGLDTVRHLSLSTIGIDTIYRSNGRIPKNFLLAAGVPDVFVTYMESLTGHTFEFYTCFISHSSKDKPFCDRLYLDLRANDVRTWYFPEDAKWGESVWAEIDSSIKIYEKTILVCSKDSLGSGPVLREIERSLNREDREEKSILFPIRIDDFIFDGWEHERKEDVVRKVGGRLFQMENKRQVRDSVQKAFGLNETQANKINVRPHT